MPTSTVTQRVTQQAKGEAFRALHERDGAFFIPNPWDAGTARILTALGFEALTTTSAGLAWSLGRRDGSRLITRDETLANAREIIEATDLPVAADLENGYGDAPETVAETIRMAGEAGLVGGSIEDATGDPSGPIYRIEHAVARVEAAVEAARALPNPFVLVGRAENYLHGNPDLKDTIRRLQAFEAAGADVLFAPGVTSRDDIRAICSSVSKPVNVVLGYLPAEDRPTSIAELAELGVKRVSLGSVLSRAALGAFVNAARELTERGTFGFVRDAISFADVSAFMAKE